jgi:hypothetical protein
MAGARSINGQRNAFRDARTASTRETGLGQSVRPRDGRIIACFEDDDHGHGMREAINQLGKL